MNKSEELIKEIENEIYTVHKGWLEDSRNNNKLEISKFKEALSKHISKFLYKKTKREPLIMVVII
jgi:mRNA degradation ribonuclease J1/J2